MRRYRLTENRLRNIIREAIKEQFGRTKDNDWDGWEDEEQQERKSWVPGARLGDLPSNHPERQRYNDWAKMAHRPKTNESRLRGMIREDIKSIFSGFSKNKGVDNQPTPENPQDDIPKGYYIYAPKELQWLYDNQDGLSEFQQDVLRAAMWVRAMRAGYHGYTKEWHCIGFKNGQLYYYDKNNNMRKIGT